ncbi:hypothetical protein LRC39_15060 [Rhodopseudomonas sp. P1]
MSDRPASWRMPTPRQMERLAEAAVRKECGGDLRPDDNLPEDYWRAILADARAQGAPAASIARRRVSDVTSASLRVSCRRCGRLVEIGAGDAGRLYGAGTALKDVARRLLDGTCESRTGRYEEDGCWPSVEMR